MSDIIERIERESGVNGLTSVLANLPPTDLQSILLQVYRLRAAARQPSALLADYETNRFVRPSPVSPVALLEWEQLAFKHLPPEVEPLALSPVCPLGANSVVAAVDQNWAVATSRNTEVVSDSTNVLALECALRRRELLRRDAKSNQTVQLATAHRLLRAQHYNAPGLSAHFAAFALASAGRDQGNLRFEFSALALHIGFYLSALRAYVGPSVQLEVSVTDIGIGNHSTSIESGLLSPLRAQFPSVQFGFDPERTSGRGYYVELCFHIHALLEDGRRLQLADGGAVEWTRRLLSNAKERLVISGIGSERLCAEFGKTTEL